MLRTGFFWQGEWSRPLQVVYRPRAMPFTVLDWRSAADLAQALERSGRDDAGARFRPDAGAVAAPDPGADRGRQRYHLIYTNHHILMDGWSNSQLLGEVLQRYCGVMPVPSGRALSRLHRVAAAAGSRRVSEAFWLEQLRALRRADATGPGADAGPVARAGATVIGEHFA